MHGGNYFSLPIIVPISTCVVYSSFSTMKGHTAEYFLIQTLLISYLTALENTGLI